MSEINVAREGGGSIFNSNSSAFLIIILIDLSGVGVRLLAETSGTVPPAINCKTNDIPQDGLPIGRTFVGIRSTG